MCVGRNLPHEHTAELLGGRGLLSFVCVHARESGRMGRGGEREVSARGCPNANSPVSLCCRLQQVDELQGLQGQLVQVQGQLAAACRKRDELRHEVALFQRMARDRHAAAMFAR